jgi:hypothetical protein
MENDPLGAPEFEPWETATEYDPNKLSFRQPKPIAQAFMLSDGPCDLLMGPEGSGKTTACMQTALIQTLRMPICNDGVIRAHGCFLRNSYRDLYKNTLPSWFSVFPRDFPGAKFEGGQDRPGRYTFRGIVPSRAQPIRIEMIVDFFGLGDVSIEQMLRGYQPSWGGLDEVDLFEKKVPTFLFGRTGRYPGGQYLTPELIRRMEAGEQVLPRRVFGSLNPPDVDHWVHEECVDKKNPFFKLFRQPSGLAPNAEFFPPVTRGKYETDARVRPPHEVRRFVHGEFGPSREGEIVFPEFNDQEHYSTEPLAYDPQTPVYLGFDQAGHPAMVIAQPNEAGQVRALAEVVPQKDGVTHISTFVEMCKIALATTCPKAIIGGAWGDPAGWYGVDRQSGELAWMETLSLALGVTIQPAPTNEIGIRLDGVRGLLVRRIDAHTPMFILAPGCKMLRKGFVSHYVNKKVSSGSTEVVKPFKNKYADVQDALQYLVLGLRGRALIIEEAANIGVSRRRARESGGTTTIIKSDFGVIG